MKNHFLILRIVLTYIFFAGVYIIYSDNLLESLVKDVAQITLYQSLKGWAFVILSGVLIGYLMYREFVSFSKVETENEIIKKQNETIFEDSLMPMFLINQIGIIQKANYSITELLNYSDWILKNMEIQLLVHPDFSGVIRQKITELAEGKERHLDFNIDLLSADGKKHSFISRLLPIDLANKDNQIILITFKAML